MRAFHSPSPAAHPLPRARPARRPRFPLALLLVVLGAFATAPSIRAQNVEWGRLPESLRLFPRDASDSCAVTVEGTVLGGDFDSVSVTVLRDDIPSLRLAEPLIYEGVRAPFSFSLPLRAELAEYDLLVHLDTVLVAERESLLCGDVLLINGQSNAVAYDYGGVVTNRSEWVRSFGTTEADSSACEADTLWGLAQAHERYAPLAVGVWGLRLGEKIATRFGVPVCLLNGAVGSTFIQQHKRKSPPLERLSTIYGRLFYRARKAGLDGAARAMLWYQGEANTSSPAPTYAGHFAELHAAWKEDYPALERIYVFQIRPGCGEDHQGLLREVLRRLPEAHEDVVALSTAGLPGHDGCHFDSCGYGRMAEWASLSVGRDLYGSTDTAGARPPNPIEAHFADSNRDAILVRFDQPIVWPLDTLGAPLEDFFYLNDSSVWVIGGAVTEDSAVLRLDLAGTTGADSLTYLPDCCYEGSTTSYKGPWIRNGRGIGAFSFHKVRMRGPLSTGVSAGERSIPPALHLEAAPNPFNASITIRADIPAAGPVRLTAFDALGRRAAVLFDGEAGPEPFVREWSPADLPSGVYFIRLESGGRSAIRKTILLK
ncbi:MAG: T9SS type A sorting domain-containing protein [Candidatus Eisenbacteria bacterium]|nr:T9SS type A sorting domain-containing protein [Candidatus Eisenbacteria bacterium]